MELFKITCLTCRARLSVRDTALVGQIIGCPRCGMMVQVTPPAESAASTASVTVAATTTASPKRSTDVEAVSNATEQAPQERDEGAGASDSIFDDAGEDFAAVEDPSTLPAATASPATAAAPVSSWSASRFAAMLLGAAIVGATVVGAAIMMLRDDPNVAETRNTESAPKVRDASPQPEANINELPAVGRPVESEPAVVEAAKPVEAEAFLPIETARDNAVDEQRPTSEATAPTASPATPDAALTQRDAPTKVEPSDPGSDSALPEPETEPRLRIDPLDVDPEGLDLTALYAGPLKDPIAASQLPAEEEPPASVHENEPAEVSAEAPPAASEAVRREEQAGRGAPAAVELLARRLPAVSVTKTPLCRFIDLATQLSGLPISVDAGELRMAAVTVGTPVSVDVKDATIEQLLARALKPLRLEPRVEGEQIVLVRRGVDVRRTVEYPVDDLAKSPEQAGQLGDWTMQLAAPEAWTDPKQSSTLVAEGGKLRVEAPLSVQYEVLFLLERYRKTARLPMRTKYPSDLLPPGSFQVQLEDQLSAPAQFTFTQPASLREVFRYWQEELQVAVLVDWPALAEEQLWPQSRIACSAKDVSWDAAMDMVLEPLGLGWRAVSPGAIEITTSMRTNSEPLLEVYRLAPDAATSGDELQAKLRELSAPERLSPAQPPGIAYDQARQVVLVRQPAMVQRKFAKWLIESGFAWRADD